MNFQALAFPHFAALAACAAAAVADARSGRIHNIITLPPAAAGLLYALLRGGDGALASSLTGLAAGVIPFGLAAGRGWIGGGDVKLFGAVGALAGPLFLLDCVFVAFVLAAGYGLILVARHPGGLRPGAITRGVWKRLIGRTVADTPDDGVLDRPVRMGVFIFAGSLAAVLHVAAGA